MTWCAPWLIPATTPASADADKLSWVIETDYDTTTHVGTLVVVPDHYQGMLRCRGTLDLAESDGATVSTVAPSDSARARVPRQRSMPW